VSAAHGAPPYFNTGSCLYASYITGIEIQNGEITLVRWATRRERMAPPRKLRSLGHWT
jgi:hypothetical protein